MTPQETVQLIEESMQRDRAYIELKRCLDRLEANRDFKALILDGYLTKEAVRLVHLKSDPSMQTPEHQASILTQIDSIGGLLTYLRQVDQFAAMAQKNLEASQLELDEVAAEEAQRG